jgi:hypothetical protein
MPTHRSVSIAIISQYDADTIPEILSRSSRQLFPIADRTITANIPVYPSSQFWISYQCPLPPPAKPNGDQTRYYYFKLYTGGKCILSWGVGEDEDWQGKVVCGFWDAGTDFEGKKIVEKRGLFFPKTGDASGKGGFEICVYRAKARKTEEVKYETFRDQGSGLNVNTIGRKKKGERQRHYTYALVDPKEAPFVTFRYIFRTEDELRKLEQQAANDEMVVPFSLSQNNLVSSTYEQVGIPTPSPRQGFDLRHGPSVQARAPRTPSPPAASGTCFKVSPGTPPSQRKSASSGLFKGVIASAWKRKEDKSK